MSYIIELIKTVFPNGGISFFYILLIILTFWMYKELRSSFIDQHKSSQQRIDKAIDVYAELEMEIYKFFLEQSDFLHVVEKMAKASSLLPYELWKQCNQCKDEADAASRKEQLKNFHAVLKQEMTNLKHKQHDSVTFKNDDNLVDRIDHYTKTKIAPFLYPLAQTLINIIILIAVVLFTIVYATEPLNTKKTLYLSSLAALVIYGALIILILSLVIMKKRFRHSILNWLLFALFILSPCLFLLKLWYEGIILLVWLIAYGFYVVKRSIRENS